MKICYLADGQSIHTQRWCRSVAQHGYDVVLLTFRPAEIAGVRVHTLRRPFQSRISQTAFLATRAFYLFAVPQVRRIIKQENPGLVHGFYATSYGLLAALSGFKPYLISVWGSDINLSTQNWLLRRLIRFTLEGAGRVFCTSIALIEKTSEYLTDTSKLVRIPFGIDLDQFNPNQSTPDFETGITTIGTTKSFESFYGIPVLIEAFAGCYQKNPDLRLHLVGKGSLERVIRDMVSQYGIDQVTTFYKDVTHEEIPKFLRGMDIFVIPSYQESFGVAALEASAMGLAVIGSDVGGIPEVVVHGETGMLVLPGDPEALQNALEKLINDKQLRFKMGKQGRDHVENNYVWSDNVQTLLNEYTKILSDPT